MDFSQLDVEDTQTEGLDFKPEPPEVVAGRVLHADADFLAYHCGYRWEEESLEKSTETLKIEIETLRIMAGAEKIALHLTLGNKGGRYQIAKVKEYQGHRKKSEGLQERVSALRAFMAGYKTPTVLPVPSYEQEADDALCQAMAAADHGGWVKEAVLWSLDKDLWMVGGLHMDPKTYKITLFPWGYGDCHLDDSTSSKKVVGRGTSFFWHQLLMGDTADGIPGLPKFGKQLSMEYWPTKALTTARQKGNANQISKIAANYTQKAAGPVAAYQYLLGCRDDREAFARVRTAYLSYYGAGTFMADDWRGGKYEATAGHMLLEQARLLWMRREPNEDVQTFFKEVMA